jgi:phosphoribosylpyrophosphate synthetase
MVTLNGTQVGQFSFANGERIFRDLDKLILQDPQRNIVEFFYDSPAAFEQLFMLIGYLNYTNAYRKTLYLNWLPYLRANSFTSKDPPMIHSILDLLQDVCRSRNWQLHVRDPHNPVYTWIKEDSIEPYIQLLLKREDINYFCFPDASKMERYHFLSEKFNVPYVFGQKYIDAVTKESLCTRLHYTTVPLDGQTVCIIIDYVDYGKVVNELAKELKEDYRAKHVILYATHTSKVVLQSDIPKDKYIEKLYTTKSMMTNSPTGWIEILEVNNNV